MAVYINVSKNQICARVEKAWNDAMPFISYEILQDCNEYCKEDSGALIASSYEQSDLDRGKLKWRTPYARRQYWLITAYKDKNPQASWKWCEVAKQHHHRKWEGMAQRALKEHL